MELKTTGVAGTLESSDVMITLEPKASGGVFIVCRRFLIVS